MLEAFRGAGIEPLGFSPPHLFFDQRLGNLMDPFFYVRIGYMEKRMLFFPKRRSLERNSFFVSISGYADYLTREVGKQTYRAWMCRYLKWGVEREQWMERLNRGEENHHLVTQDFLRGKEVGRKPCGLFPIRGQGRRDDEKGN